jgi:hypothetical protein
MSFPVIRDPRHRGPDYNRKTTFRRIKSFGLLQYILGSDFNRLVQRPVDGTMLSVDAVYTLDGFSSLGRSCHMIGDVNSPNHQYVILCLDLSSNIRRQSVVAGVDLARFQRGTEGADQSAAGGRHHVIQRCSMRLCNLWANVIVFGDSPMHTEVHRF